MSDRYSRQIRFTPVGPEGQARISDATVSVVGVGALGTHVADALARAGVGHLVLVDRDVVEPSNLQRQVLFDEADARAARPKSEAAAARLASVNSDVRITAVVDEFDTECHAAGPRPDLLIDATDNFPTRMLINDLAVRDGVPWIYGAAIGSAGRAAVVVPGVTPCLRCLMPEPPPTAEVGTCETEGVIAPVIAQVAAFQTAQALRLLATEGREHARGVFLFDPWTGEARHSLADAAADPNCATCGTHEFPALDSAAGDVVMCGRDVVQVRPRSRGALDLAALAPRLEAAAASVDLQPSLLRFTAEDCRFTLFPTGRALVFGTRDLDRARVLYDRYVGM